MAEAMDIRHDAPIVRLRDDYGGDRTFEDRADLAVRMSQCGGIALCEVAIDWQSVPGSTGMQSDKKTLDYDDARGLIRAIRDSFLVPGDVPDLGLYTLTRHKGSAVLSYTIEDGSSVGITPALDGFLLLTQGLSRVTVKGFDTHDIHSLPTVDTAPQLAPPTSAVAEVPENVPGATVPKTTLAGRDLRGSYQRKRNRWRRDKNWLP